MTSTSTKRIFALASTALAAALVVSACGSGGTKAASSSDGKLTPPKVTLSDATQASFVNVKYGPITDGSKYGIPMTLKNFTEFDSNETATQAVLSGKAQIVGTSLMGTLAADAAGANLKTFCPYVNQDDLVLVGRNGVNSIGQLFNDKTRVGVDSPGGAADEVLNAILQAKGINHTTKDLKHKNVLESASLRQSAFASNSLDATIIHSTQYEQIKSQVPGSTIIATLFKDVPHFVKNTYAATGTWLDSNLKTAAAFCASVLEGNAELAANKSTYLAAVKKYIDQPPPAGDLDTLWTDARQYAFWPTVNNPQAGLDNNTLSFMAKVGVGAGVLKSTPKPADMLDPRPIKMAMKLVAAQSANKGK